MNAIDLNEIILIILVIFNVGFTMGIYFNHIRHNKKAIEDIKKDIDNLFQNVNAIRDRISRLEGKLNNK